MRQLFVIPIALAFATPANAVPSTSRDVTRISILPLASAPVEHGSIAVGKQRLWYVRGGTVATAYSRNLESVNRLVQRSRALAGLNGTFFGPKNQIVGPMLASLPKTFQPLAPYDARPCAGRPLSSCPPTPLPSCPSSRRWAAALPH